MLTFDPKQMETNLNQLLEDEGGGSGATTGVGGRDICRETSVGKSGQRRERERETQRNRSSDVLQARAQRSSYVARNSFFFPRNTLLDDVSRVYSFIPNESPGEKKKR